MPVLWKGKVWIRIREGGTWKLKSMSEPVGQFLEIPFPSAESLREFCNRKIKTGEMQETEW
ncbi:MAG: hypothetical protein DRP12_00200 [Candidatus Aenigmatarchaeota archaeon]|nr:MAG: hypothetical protein DRP12_00200 [Candidatus Aenigmarchaeota archaeon]